jgi:hypothetical protein
MTLECPQCHEKNLDTAEKCKRCEYKFPKRTGKSHNSLKPTLPKPEKIERSDSTKGINKK